MATTPRTSVAGHTLPGLAIGITGNRSDAEEVVRDALWTVVRRIDY